MSGTSLDGLDLALCRFSETKKGYSYSILRADTIAYSSAWKTALNGLPRSSAESYFLAHHLYGRYIAAQIRRFLNAGKHRPEAISSHGHTIFHQPKAGFTSQLGCGATIAANTGIMTVCDLRSLDVALKGQGAPLVPIGDKLLFSQYESCLNLGGIANISYDDAEGNRRAFDICVANMALNHLAQKNGHEYDDNGMSARSGRVIPSLLEQLEQLDFYKQPQPKSVGREWFEAEFLPLIGSPELPVNDVLNTCCVHIAKQIAAVLNDNKIGSVLVTGGGAFNTFLIEKLKENYKGRIIIPDSDTICFKEALIFAFLGWLRIKGKINTLATVTGAMRDSIGGAIYSS